MTLIKSTNPAYHFLKCSKTTVGVQISTVRKTNIHRNGEENVLMKVHAYVHR